MLYRSYAIKYISLPEVKNLLIYFNCDLKQKNSLGRFIRNLNYDPTKPDETRNMNIQCLKGLGITNPSLLNKKICKINWN